MAVAAAAGRGRLRPAVTPYFVRIIRRRTGMYTSPAIHAPSAANNTTAGSHASMLLLAIDGTDLMADLAVESVNNGPGFTADGSCDSSSRIRTSSATSSSE